MRIQYLALVALCGCALQSSLAWAQALTQPASIRPAALSHESRDAYGYRYYDDQEEPSPSDAPAVEAQDAPAVREPVVPTTQPCEACRVVPWDSCCESPFLFGPAKPLALFPGDNRLGVRAGFWTQVGYHTPGTNGSGDGLLNNYPNHVQLQQQWAFLERPVDTGGSGFDWGFRVDYVYGTDGPDTQAFGNPPDSWDFGWNQGGAYGHAIPQAYVAVGFNDLTAKIGHFISPLSYEVVPATGNFFYSHSFEHGLIEPFTHTGVLLEQRVTDNVTLLGGWTAGWDTGFDRNGGSTFIGGFTLQLTEKASFSYMTSWGDVGYDTPWQVGSDANGYFHMLLFTWRLTDRWTYVLQSDLMDNDAYFASTTDAVSVNNYLFYQFNERWTAGLRCEWLRDPTLPGSYVGGADEVVDVTVGLNYRPAANVVVRPEVRWDDYESDSARRDTCVFGIDTVITY